jgi:hypothetical protein
MFIPCKRSELLVYKKGPRIWGQLGVCDSVTLYSISNNTSTISATEHAKGLKLFSDLFGQRVFPKCIYILWSTEGHMNQGTNEKNATFSKFLSCLNLK